METTRSHGFDGPFAAFAEEFIAFKRSLGYAYRNEERQMRNFCRFTENCTSSELTKELVLEWCKKRKNECVLAQRQRKRIIRQFGVYMQQMGHPAFIVSKEVGRVARNPYVPYIFTQDEIQSLLHSMDSLMENSWAHGRFVHPLLLRILYGCGLRVSEAAGLQIRDVNLDEGILTVRNSKFEKDRLIPMSDSLTSACRAYAQKHLITQKTSCFFPSPDGTPYSCKTIYHHFRRALAKSGIPHRGKGYGPRLHDLRHTFAVHCLNRWTEQGKDISAALPVLAAYLGHDSLLMTQQYFRLTPEIYPALLASIEKACDGMIPKVAVPS